MGRLSFEQSKKVLEKSPWLYDPMGGHAMHWLVLKMEEVLKRLDEIDQKLEAGVPEIGFSDAQQPNKPIARELTADHRRHLTETLGISKFLQGTIDACLKHHNNLGYFPTAQQRDDHMAMLDHGVCYSDNALMTRWLTGTIEMKALVYFYKWAGLIEYRKSPRKGYYKIQLA